MKNAMSDDALLLIVACLLVVGSAVAFLLSRGRTKARYLAMRRAAAGQAGGHSHPAEVCAGHGNLEGPSSGQAAAIVRATDLMRLGKDDEAKRIEATRLIEEGKVLEGARLLEELSLQRYAISALEQAHLIDDACAVLVRMNRPGRAGVIYQRNAMPLKAAEQFLVANMPNEAARCYIEAGIFAKNGDSGSGAAGSAAAAAATHLCKAADIYEGLGKYPEALDAFARGELASHFVQFCLKYSLYEALRDYMHDAKNTRAGFAVLDMYTTKKLVKAIGLDTQTAGSLSLWCKTVKRVELIEMSLRKLEESKNLLSLFWSLLPEDLTAQIVTSLLSAPQFKGPEGKPFLLHNARALHDAKRNAHAALFYEHTGRVLMAAKCQALAGDPGYALDLTLLQDGDEVLANELFALLSKYSESPRARHARYSTEVTAAAARIFATVDPDADELHTTSPFSLTA